MATENQKIVAKRVAAKVGKGGKVSISKEMRESGVYSESVSKNPEKLTGSKGWKELMERYLPDETLGAIHEELLNAKHLDHMVFPPTAKLTDPEIKEYIEACGCKLRRISHGEQAIHVFFYAPDNRARKDALDMAFKLKGRYAPLRVYTEPDPLEDLPDDELNRQLKEAESELARRLNPQKGNAGKKGRVASKK